MSQTAGLSCLSVPYDALRRDWSLQKQYFFRNGTTDDSDVFGNMAMMLEFPLAMMRSNLDAAIKAWQNGGVEEDEEALTAGTGLTLHSSLKEHRDDVSAKRVDCPENLM